MKGPSDHRYLIALGSNRCDGRHGKPAAVVQAAFLYLDHYGNVQAVSSVTASAPLGPSLRKYANAAALLTTRLGPQALLHELKAVERAFGRRRGQRWGQRVLDLDIILWSGGRIGTPNLTIPHPAFRQRDFVLGPAVQLAPEWRDPVTKLTIRQLRYRLIRPKPLDRAACSL